MAYGTPYEESDIVPYYTHIRRGRKPSDEQIEDLKRTLQSDWWYFTFSGYN
jgi:ferrochelatase